MKGGSERYSKHDFETGPFLKFVKLKNAATTKHIFDLQKVKIDLVENISSKIMKFVIELCSAHKNSKRISISLTDPTAVFTF